MTQNGYLKKIDTLGFEQFPYFITGNEKPISEIIPFQEADLELRIHLAEVIICRCFSPIGGIPFVQDSTWFINEFLLFYENDIPKPWITPTIRRGIEMILREDGFTSGVIATTFMFGVLESHAKYILGYKAIEGDFFDKEYHQKFRSMFIGDAINKVKRTNTGIARSLIKIDKHNTERLRELGIEETRWTKAKIADRLMLARNTMLHGENHSFYAEGQYLVMLYMLFHLHDLYSIA